MPCVAKNTLRNSYDEPRKLHCNNLRGQSKQNFNKEGVSNGKSENH